MFSIDIRGGTPIYEQLCNRITELISTGAFAENEQLPPVREIAKELGVNPNTVQKTYQALEQKGLIYSIPAKGSYVSKNNDVIITLREQAMQKFRQSAETALKCGVKTAALKEALENIERGIQI